MPRELVAGPTGASYRTSSGYEVRLAPSTSVRFEPATKLQLTISASTPTQVLELRSGRVEIRSPSRPTGPQALMVRSADKRVMGVFTTGDGVVLASGEALTVGSHRGGVLVGVDNAWRPLREGYARTISREDRAGQPRPLPVAPRIELGSRLILSGGGAAQATWMPVFGAVHYEVTMVTKAGAVTRRMAVDARVQFAHLDPGTYTVTVRAFDRSGVPGPACAAQQIRVVRPLLPPGAYIGSDGAIRLDPTERVLLDGAEGLWMTYGNARQFVPAPESVGLFRGQAVRICLRDPQTTDELGLDLVPRIQRAAVNFEPLRPRWPDDPVTIRVELYDGHGQPARASSTVKVDVSVNQRRLSPVWTRRGNRLIGSVRPSSPVGPWSLRVLVARPTGEIIGRNSLRIADF